MQKVVILVKLYKTIKHCCTIRLFICIYILYLSDAFIQSDLQCTFRLYICIVSVCSLGIEPTTFALLTQCSTTEPQEHYQPGQCM